MKKQSLAMLQRKITALSILLLINFAVASSSQTTYAINNPVTTAWNLNLSLQSNNVTIISGNQQATFAPFDLIQLTTNLANGNLTAPGTPLVFNVKGPSTSSFPQKSQKAQ
jgi:hypothetical protein